jgi:hypothetical protein
MMIDTSSSKQYGRRATLQVFRPEVKGNNPSAYVPPSFMDLSEMHFRFSTSQQDVESPNNCTIRVWNLKEDTVAALQLGEYSRVVLQAGYEHTGFGVIFDGTIMQFRIGRENQTDTYLDILAGDGEEVYNNAVVSQTLAAPWTHEQAINTAIAAMSAMGIPAGVLVKDGWLGGTIPHVRGKVMFGLSRVQLRNSTRSVGATWSIDNGVVNVIPLLGYKPSEAVVLTAQTGLIGRVEQTTTGMIAKCLLNPRIEIATRVKIDNKSINRLVNTSANTFGIPFNKRAAIPVQLASEAADGIYRVFVAEHEGDTRGSHWHTNLTCLAIDPSTNKVKNND